MVVIMGGDGSLGQTIRELRKTSIIDEHINKITFCLLPFGTGNDTGQVFGWGSKYRLFHEINTFRLAREMGQGPGHSYALPAGGKEGQPDPVEREHRWGPLRCPPFPNRE